MSQMRSYDVQMTDRAGQALWMKQIPAEAFTVEDGDLKFWVSSRITAVFRVWDWVAESDED
jgi:hypothetical protein